MKKVNIDKSFEEDFSSTNGSYVNECKICKDFFLGYKFRRTCKECTTTSCKKEDEKN